MARKETIKTLDDFPHLAVLSLLEYSVCFTTNGLTAFLGEELECSFNLCLVVKATTATNLLQPNVDDVNSYESLYSAKKKASRAILALPSSRIYEFMN